SYDGGAAGAVLTINSNAPVIFNDAQATIQTLNLTANGSSMAFNGTASLQVNGATTIGTSGSAACTLTCAGAGASLGTVTIGTPSAGVFNVQGSAQVTTGSINIGASNSSVSDGTMTINGAGATVLVNGGSVINVGASSSFGTITST